MQSASTPQRDNLRRAFFQGLRRWHEEAERPARGRVEESSVGDSSYVPSRHKEEMMDSKSSDAKHVASEVPCPRHHSYPSGSSSSIHESDLRDISALCEANRPLLKPPTQPIAEAGIDSNAYFRALREVQQRLYPSS